MTTETHIEHGKRVGHPRLQALALALVTSGLVILALPTVELAVLGLVAWAPFLYVVHPACNTSRRLRFWAGFLCGFAYQLVLFRWIPFTLTEMTPFPGALTWLMCVAYAVWHALQIAIFAAVLPAVTRLVSGRFPALVPVVMAAFFAFVEWAFPALFPWSHGHSIWEVGALSAPLLALQGVPLLTMWVLLPSALLADVFARPTERRAIAVTVAVAVSLWAVGALARAVFLTETEQTVRVAVVQPNFVLAEKKRANRAMRERLLDRVEAQLRALPTDLDLVVASEGAFPLWWRLDAGPLAQASPADRQDSILWGTRRIQRAIAEGPKAHTILGGLRTDEDGETRNAAVHLGPDGTILGHYDKQTLVPFSEYVPFADVFPGLKDIRGIGHMMAGDRPCRFEGAGLPIACGICYESMFAGDTRRDAGDARLLVNLTIDTWFGTSTAPRMHLMTHASRAAELGIPLLRAGLTGISAVIGPDGQVIASLPLDTPGVLRAGVPVMSGTTIYRAIGQVLMPLLGLGLGFALARGLWRRVRARFARSR